MPSVAITGTSDVVLVPAPGANLMIRVLALVLGSKATETVTLESVLADPATTTAKTGAMPLTADAAPMVWPYAKSGYFDCGENEALNLNKSGAGALGGLLTYSLEPV